MLLDANMNLRTLVGDVAQLRNDVATSAVVLVNAVQSSPTNTPSLTSIQNQWGKARNEFAADWSKTYQAFVQVEYDVMAVLGQDFQPLFSALSIEPLDPFSSSPPPAAPPTVFRTTYSTTDPTPPPTPASPSATGSDPLYVLDLNTGETIPANVPLNTFSTWAVNLLAQVSGTTVSSYSWNLSQAPDLTNVSGTSTANLQGTWANFSGSTRSDTISVTETPQSGSPLTQTMTFLVAGTSSPAYSSTPPTSSSTWPTVITPDKLLSGQPTQSAGPYASIGEADGSVQTSFSMPSYNPNTTPVSLDYNSTTANPQPIFLTEYQLPVGQAVPATITAQLTFDGTALTTVTYNTAGLNPGDIVQMALQANATGLSTGRYPWAITVTNGSTPTTYSGNVDIVNQASSPYGAGWSLDNVEQLVSVSGGMMLVNPDGTSLFFASNGQGGFTTPAGDFSTLVQNQNGSYTRTLTDGTQLNFNSSGQQTSSVDRDGNTTTFGYTNGLLTTITDMNGQVTTLTYSGGKLSAITDPANRTATLAYSGSQLTTITDPANDVWSYAYDSSNDLTKLTDPNNNATTFTYNFADRIASVTRADNTTEQLTAMQMNGLAAPGTGTAGNPAPAVLLATGDHALFTDGNGNVWTTAVDWLGFGSATANIDPLGDAALNYINANGLVWLSADALGRPTYTFFNSQGNATQIVYADNSYALYQYNNFSEPTRYTDPTGDTTTYTYDSKGNLIQETDALGYSTTFAYNNAGLLTSETDPLGHVTQYAYNTLNEQTSVTNALNQTTSSTYNNAGMVVSTTDPLGFTDTYRYDALNRLTSQTLADNSTTSSTTTFTYDNDGNKISETDPLGHVTTYTYNAVNEMTAVTNALYQTTTYGYDGNGNQISVTNPLNDTTTNTYNAANELVRVTNALGYATTYTYDAAGEKISQTNPLNQTTTFSYDVRGWLSSETDPLGNTTNYTYDADGDQISSSLAGTMVNPETALYAYNGVQEETSSTDPLGDTTGSQYDADGNLISQTDPLGNTTTYSYNALNQLVSTTNALNQTTTCTYDADGNKISETNALGQTTRYTYDAQGRVLTVTAPNGGVTTYTYDLAGNLLSVTDPDNNTTSYSYNAVNELVCTTNPLGYATNYTYDAAGDQTSVTDADGRTIDYGYNAVSEQTSETWVGGNYTATYQYNAAGELTSASDPYSTYTYTYDADGRETSVSNAGTPGVPTVTLSYSYDAYGNRTGLTDNVGDDLMYYYNGASQLTNLWVETGGGLMLNLSAVLSFSYDSDGLLTGMTRATGMGGDGISTSYSYDKLNELTNITDTDTTKSVTLASYSYGYNAGGELVSYQDNSNSSLTYSYDANGELTGASGTLNGSNYSVSYSYDLNGNRTMSGYQTGTGNELLSDGTYNYTYDKDGNMTSQTSIATGTVTYYTWDYENRLTEEKVENSQGQVLSDEKFTYDVNNNRIAVSLNGTPQLYTVYDGSNPYLDFNGNGQMTELYLANPKALSQFYGQVNSSGTPEWFLTDNINSIRQVISASGSVLDAITYDPYGNILSQTNAANAPRLMYAGGAVDSLTGNYQFGVRPDSPTDGRFLTTDWKSFAAGNPNLYGYVFNATTNDTDPSGLEPDSIIDWSLPWVQATLPPAMLAGTAGNAGSNTEIIIPRTKNDMLSILPPLIGSTGPLPPFPPNWGAPWPKLPTGAPTPLPPHLPTVVLDITPGRTPPPPTQLPPGGITPPPPPLVLPPPLPIYFKNIIDWYFPDPSGPTPTA